MTKAILIFSGGQDSTTCLYWALKNFDVVEAITFNYGQKHSIELQCSMEICTLEAIKQTIIDISFLNTLVESALTSNGDVNEINAKGLPASFVPNRNALFITLAHAYAQKIGAEAVITGVCETDFSGYPDCRKVFIDKIREALNTGSDSDIRIITPLMHLNKGEIFELAHSLGKISEVVTLSHTCYNGNHSTINEWGYGCGECPACKLREKGFDEFKKNWNHGV
jgi:7-cyano-7-deazaguanine synthase